MLSAETGYRAGIEQWRVNHEAELKSENGWLSVAGLFWLETGANSAGSESSNAIVLPRGPARVGVFDFEKGNTTFHSAPGVAAKLNGQPVSSATVKPDSDGPPDKIEIAGLTLTVIHRGDSYGVRLRDPQSRTRSEFGGLHWFPVDEKYRVRGRFVAYEKPKTIQITNVLGQTEPEPTPGYVEFTLNGSELHLEPVDDDHQLFFIFRDLTAGHETYPAGRFLYAEWPKNGEVELDFNKAENPPCAFTAYATCPLPPKHNHLDVRVEAGERNYDTH
jgi:uncharacterized protein (DUF1684 family)